MDNKCKIILKSEGVFPMFHENLKLLREKDNISREHLAKSLDITYSALSKYETGKREPDFELLQKIADFFNVSTDYLLGREQSPSNKKITFDEFIQDNDLRDWYKKMGQAPEEDLADLKVFYETFIAKKHEK